MHAMLLSYVLCCLSLEQIFIRIWFLHPSFIRHIFCKWTVKDVYLAGRNLFIRLPLVVQEDCERPKVRLPRCRLIIQDSLGVLKSKDWRLLSSMHADYNFWWERNNRCVLSDLWLRIPNALFWAHYLFGTWGVISIILGHLQRWQHTPCLQWDWHISDAMTATMFLLLALWC